MKKWRTVSAKQRFAAGLPSDMNLFTSRPEVHPRGLPATDRVKDFLDVTYGTFKLASPGLSHRQIISNLYANPSQCVSRKPKTLNSGMGTATTSSFFNSFERDVAISAAGILRLHGWHRHCAPAERFSEWQCRSLSGDSVSVPCAGLLQSAVILNPWAPWWGR